MKKKIEEWLLKLGEITELQNCLADVLENSVHKDENPYHALSLVDHLRERTTALYENIDDYTVGLSTKHEGPDEDLPDEE